ncbi:GNAT family N-acetyltransferase [Ktedonobacter robiniae]|uniref:Acetyltransferase, GNAT n=1 Tax=Ktedonobacter robiniae TaxID=2778365 RepID=A0ABQ3UUZ5_9CHLR|nr:GNAT family N-acetyltransferase [Ktedonobacter robiniae]GHO56155.1 putative acetyltransferase, GNAT [Ktedonobacter robiniae]
MSNALPEGFTLRPATLDDVPAIYGLFQSHERALYGYTDKFLASVQVPYSSPTLDLAEQTCLVFDQAGRLVGSMLLEQSMYTTFSVTICVFPPEPGSHVNHYLLRLAVSKARTLMAQAQPGVQVTLDSWVSSLDQESLQCYEMAGFQEVRRNWRMEIELNGRPASPTWPEGVVLRPFVPERDDHAVFEMIERAFRDHWGHSPEDFAEWRHWAIEQVGFDPSLYHIAWVGDQPIGGALCSTGPVGWINTLAVAREWRGRGVGLALLQHAFGAFYRRGLRRVSLSVDTQNLTGATRLYQRAGMRKTREYLFLQKELLIGIPPLAK